MSKLSHNFPFLVNYPFKDLICANLGCLMTIKCSIPPARFIECVPCFYDRTNVDVRGNKRYMFEGSCVSLYNSGSPRTPIFSKCPFWDHTSSVRLGSFGDFRCSLAHMAPPVCKPNKVPEVIKHMGRGNDRGGWRSKNNSSCKSELQHKRDQREWLFNY